MDGSPKNLERRHWKMLVLAISGIGILLLSQAAYMEVFSYPVTTRSIENGILHVDITFIDPLSSLFPILLVSGVFISTFGFWKSRNVLLQHTRAMWVGLLVGTVLTLISLINVQHQLTNGPNEYYNYGFPLPWLVNIIVDLPFQRSLWVPTLGLIDDLLFWASLAYLGMLVSKRLRKSR